MEAHKSKITSKCTLCMECINVCPTDSIYLGVGQYVIDTDSCEACRYCIPICPDNAIMIDQPKDANKASE